MKIYMYMLGWSSAEILDIYTRVVDYNPESQNRILALQNDEIGCYSNYSAGFK